ncbi:monoamine oxidase [Saccharothrix carnea]|uniref:Monoamine oxidase n=1 Tax=Saccharothrix carnea TaxID=1280637 RepID=A0A2P8HQY4_SACCR|nr:NAD(P)/FAD-dependent oxidoreductase [Saccharothrix carnea]PSL48636.1 monoamine oxidase [Saccharothrix carnea]
MELSRRGFLSGVVGGVAAGVLASSPQAHGDDSTESRGYDAIVVGAGFAGVTAARELRAAGLRVLVLEARPRVGGKAFSQTFAGKTIDLGASWFSPHHPLVTAELRRYGIDLVPEGVFPEKVLMPTVDGVAQFDPQTAFAHFDHLLGVFFEGTRDYYPDPYRPLAAGEVIRRLDQLTLRERLDQLPVSEQDKLWLSNVTSTYAGGDSSRGAFTPMAQWWAAAGHDAAGWNTFIGQAPVGGVGNFLQRMLDDARAEVRLSNPVTRVVDAGDHVRVTTRSGRVFSAKTVVVAVPPNIWKKIDFSPGLPAVHVDAAARQLNVPYSAKFWLRTRGDIGSLSASAAEGYPVNSLFTYHQLDDGDQLMIGFSQDDTFNVYDRAQLQEAVSLFGPIEVLDVRAVDWGRDEFSLGGWAYRRPGQLFAHLPGIQQPHGRMTFANEGLSTSWGGFVEGAIESGFRAAEQALDRVRA